MSKSSNTVQDFNTELATLLLAVDDAAATADKTAEAALQELRLAPSMFTHEAALAIVVAAHGNTLLRDLYGPQDVVSMKNEITEKFYPARVDGITPALERLLETTIAPLPTWKSATIKWFSELPSKIYAPAVTGPERDSLLDERDKREADALATESNIALARAAIERFKLYPTQAHYADACGTISTIRF